MIPDEEVLRACYLRAKKARILERALDRADTAFDANKVRVPKNLGDRVKRLLKSNERLSWDGAIASLARERRAMGA